MPHVELICSDCGYRASAAEWIVEIQDGEIIGYTCPDCHGFGRAA